MGRMSECVIGIDVGTSAVKVAAFNELGLRHLEEREYHHSDFSVQGPLAITAATLDALSACVAHCNAHVAAIGLSAAMHGLMALDSGSKPLTHLLTWADTRATDEAVTLMASVQARQLHRETGTPIHPMSPLLKLMWFSRHEPELFRSAERWIGLKDYLLLSLTGEVVTELSTASATGLMSMQSQTWSIRALETCGVSKKQLPEIVSPTACFRMEPTIATKVGLSQATTVVAGAADGPLANLGVGAMSPGVSGLSLGTSGAVRLVFPEPRLDDDLSLFCYALTEDLWTVGGAISNGGSALSWIANAVGCADESEAVDLASRVPMGCDGLEMRPYLLPERSPLWNPNLAASLTGLKSLHTRGHLVRATIEGVCRELGGVIERLTAVGPVNLIRATGGAFRSPLWAETLEAVTGRRVEVISSRSGTALGAAAMAAVAVGMSEDLESAAATFRE